MECIYCKNDITEVNKSTEHVFPEAFGCPDNWLLDCVCRNCNNEFGRSIERYLAGDSLEGLWRLQKIGSRSKKPIRQTRIRMRIPDEDRYGDFRGITLYGDFAQMDSLYLPAQVITFGSNGERKSTLIEKMTDDEIKNITGRFEFFAHNEKEYNQVAEYLKQLGKKIEEGKVNRLPETAINKDGKLEVEIEGVMDLIIFRTIAKIAFNYLAKAKGAKYALDQNFDSVRDYIKTGNKPNFEIVRIEKGHILAEETKNQYFLEGHILTIETRGNDIISKIALTNAFNFYYVVYLGKIGLIWHDIKSGHAYSLKEDKMIPLFSPTFLILKSKLRRIFGY